MDEHEVLGWMSAEYLDGCARSTWMDEHGVLGFEKLSISRERADYFKEVRVRCLCGRESGVLKGG